jgi:tRNA-specific adenosine deaminase 1
MKCLPVSKIPQAQGVVLHDCHAEIISIRAFNRFLIQECAILTQDNPASSPWIRRLRPGEMSEYFQQPFAFEENVTIYFYSSEAPCGDASMELTMLAQEDATPWETPSSAAEQLEVGTSGPTLMGRGYFSDLGVVRRKPGLFLIPT